LHGYLGSIKVRSAKFWLDPVMLARNLGFGAHGLRQIETLIRDHREPRMEAWNDWFGDQAG
jgi:hypothetical protein